MKLLRPGLVIALMYSFPLWGQIIYLSPSGSDLATGTSQQPLQTMQQAIDKAVHLNQQSGQDVKIILKKGSYYLKEAVLIDKWFSNNKLTISGEENVFIKGGIPLKKFQKVSDSLWKTNIPRVAVYGRNNVQQLFVNGRRAIRARTPNENIFYKTGIVSEIVMDSSRRGLAVQKIKLSPEQYNTISNSFLNDAKPVITIHHAWDRTRRFVDHVSKSDSSLYIITNPMPVWNKLDNSSQFYFENSAAFLDRPGEWYLHNNGDIFYIPLPGEDINTTVVEIPILDNLFVIQGSRKKKFPILNLIIFHSDTQGT